MLMDVAARANQSDACRIGGLIELPDEGEVMVTGDLHGHSSNLWRIIDLADLSRCRNRHLILQELVHEIDALDDICRSYRLVEIAARLKAAYPDRVHVLLGNHEVSEVMGLEIGKRGRELNAAFREGVRAAYGARGAEVYAAYHRFWRSCPLAAHTQNRIFISHSTPRIEKAPELDLSYLRRISEEKIFDRDGSIFAMLWGRDYRPSSADEFARRMDADLLLVGHTACCDGIHAPNARHVIFDCKDLAACYALLPLDKPVTQAEVLSSARRLNEILPSDLISTEG